MKLNFVRRFSGTFVVLGCAALLIAGSVPLMNVSGAQQCTNVIGDGMNTGPVIDGPDRSRDLGQLKDGDCFSVTEKAVANNGPGEFVDEAEIECQLGGDPYERWYKFELTEPLWVSVDISFPNAKSDVDLLMFADFSMPNADFPQGIKIFRGSLNPEGFQERIRPVKLPAGKYHVGVSNFTGSPTTDVTTTIRAGKTGPYQDFPARFENATTQQQGNIDAIFCGTTDLTVIALADNLAYANRLTPVSFPATLTDVQVLLFSRQNQPTISGQKLKILVYTDPDGKGMGPSGTPVVNEERNYGSGGILSTFKLTNPVTIQKGDFYVSVFFEGPHNGRGPLFYIQIPDVKRTFISRGNITSWSTSPVVLRDAMMKEFPASAYVGGLINAGGPTAGKAGAAKVSSPVEAIQSTVVDLQAERVRVNEQGALEIIK